MKGQYEQPAKGNLPSGGRVPEFWARIVLDSENGKDYGFLEVLRVSPDVEGGDGSGFADLPEGAAARYGVAMEANQISNLRAAGVGFYVRMREECGADGSLCYTFDWPTAMSFFAKVTNDNYDFVEVELVDGSWAVKSGGESGAASEINGKTGLHTYKGDDFYVRMYKITESGTDYYRFESYRDIPAPPEEPCIFVHDEVNGTRWLIVGDKQGAFCNPAGDEVEAVSQRATS